MKFFLSATFLSMVGHVAASGYGPLYPTKDEATGLYLLELPRGFSYISYGWTGQTMDDGQATPTDHDGMAVSGRRGDIISMVRNHECSRGEGPLVKVAGGTYGSGKEHGSNTNIYFDLKRGKFTRSYASLAGIIRPCAGGLTPWGSWIAAEENFSVDPEGFTHGWIFDVPAFGTSNAKPIKNAGRFIHEAAAVDPSTGVVYLTEDQTRSGIYKYVMPGAGSRNWRRRVGLNKREFLLKDGGDLFVLAVKNEPAKDLSLTLSDGETFKVEWVKVPDPQARNQSNKNYVFNSVNASAIFARGEGAWFENGLLYFVSTSGGAISEGQVFTYDPRTDILTMIYETRDRAKVDNPDNIAVTKGGGVILCEDGSSDPKRLIGLDKRGNTFEFAKNIISLNADDLALIDSVYPGTQANFWDSVEVEDADASTRQSFTGREWAGATFYEDWLFVNVQSPGVTFAITGPWEKGIFKVTEREH